MDEITSHVNNYVLDDDTSLFEILAEISAAEASIPVSKQSANLAAQVNHTRFYIDVLIQQQENAVTRHEVERYLSTVQFPEA